MTMPPMDQVPPMDEPWAELWMSVADVFHIKGRGTVVTGRLEGNGQLNVGDTAVADGMTWQIGGIEKFRTVLSTAEPGETIGVLLKNGPAGMMRDQRLMFVPKGADVPNLRSSKKRWRS